MNIALTGFMGCGKSTVAACLAQKTGCFYFDLDDTIVMEEGKSISEIFESEGESGFRILELDYLSRILSDYEDFPATIIISLGGGTVMTPQCAELIRKKCTCVYLRASVDELVRNLKETGTEDRPLLSSASDNTQALRQKVEELMAKRASTYEKVADTIIEIDSLSPEEISDRIIDAVM